MEQATIKVVLLDDHQLFLNGLNDIIDGQADMQVLAMFNSGLKLLENYTLLEEADILITDIAMPDINGVSLIPKIKKSYSKIKILVISMFDNMLDKSMVNGYLTKSMSKEELLTSIREIVINGKIASPSDSKSTPTYLHSELTSREKEVLLCIADGLSVKQIADKLFLSNHTIEAHKKNIYLKLKVRNAAELISISFKLGYL